MKPYKILHPGKTLWDKDVEVFMSERKHYKLPLKLFMKCHPIPKDLHVSKLVRINKHD